MNDPKPWVCKIPRTDVWEAVVTRGFSGNYEHDMRTFTSWRAAYDWAYNEVKDWSPSVRVPWHTS